VRAIDRRNQSSGFFFGRHVSERGRLGDVLLTRDGRLGSLDVRELSLGTMASIGAALRTRRRTVPPRRLGALIQDNGGEGVMIRSITPGGPASRVYLKEMQVYGYMIPGDVIVEANGQPIRSVRDFFEAVRDSGDVLEGRFRDPRDGRVSTFRAELARGP
jgi:hypothetical protein